MATLTIRNVPPRLVQSLKKLAKQRRNSMEAQVRELLEESVGERLSVLEQIEDSWKLQTRRPSAHEIEDWVATGRE
jgi:plasmid stability protein